jgi:hypothetical protein
LALSGPDELENEPGLALPAVGGTVVESLAAPFPGSGFDGEYGPETLEPGA